MGSKVHRPGSAGDGFLQNPTQALGPSDFRQLAEHLPHMVWICGPDGTLDYMNSHGLGYFGVKLRDAIKRFPAGPLAHPDDREGSRTAWERALQLEEALTMEARLLRSDGAFRWHLIRAEPVWNDVGQVVRWMGTSTNVHSVKEGDELSAFLLELSTDFARIDNPHELVATAMLRLRRHLGAARVTLAEFDHSRGEAATGPGISRNLLPHVFDLFTQAERTLDRAEGGLGIGLTLAKLLVEMHGGTVEARNADTGLGAEFIVRLPANTIRSRVGPAEAAPALTPSDVKPMKILVVDDNVDAADSIALLLNIDAFEAHSVHGAIAALDTVGAFRPDVVLLDIGLPVMDGYELAQRLRAHIPIERMRIVALSGYGQQAHRQRAAQAGFDDFLVKPVEPTALSEFLRSLQ